MYIYIYNEHLRAFITAQVLPKHPDLKKYGSNEEMHRSSSAPRDLTEKKLQSKKNADKMVVFVKRVILIWTKCLGFSFVISVFCGNSRSKEYVFWGQF